VLKLLTAVASQTGEQRGRSYKISTVPLLVLPALLDDVYVVADLEGKVLSLGCVKRVCADGKGDCWQRLPGHGGGSVLACAMGRDVVCSRRGCE